MRILQINFETGWRGGERQTLLCMQQFRQAGHEVTLLARKDEALATAALDEGFVVVERENAFRLSTFLLKHGREFDLLHAQTAGAMTWLALLRKRIRRPIVFTRRTAFPLQGNPAKTRWKWRQADLFVAISEAAAAEPRRMGIPVTIIPSAVVARPPDSPRMQVFAARFNPQGKRLLATAGALTREKDPCTLIRAVHRLKQVRDDFIFVHLGQGGDAEGAARELVAELGLEDDYVFAGFQSGIEDYYRLMDVYVVSSMQEALGTGVLDAFLYCVPVVATRTGGLMESLGEDRGLLCEVGDDEAMAQSIALVLDDQALRESLVEKAHAYVARRHDAGRMARAYLEEFQRLTQPAEEAPRLPAPGP